MAHSPSGPRRFAHPRLHASIALAAGAALTLAGCTADHTAAAPSGTLAVVATTTQLTDFAREIGGDDISLHGLLVTGGSAHQFDPTPADLLALGNADVLIVNGAGLESFIDDAIDASGFDGEIVTASDGIDLVEAEQITAEGEAEAAGEHQVATDAHEGHTHEGHGHDEADDAHAADTDHAEHDDHSHAEHDHAAEPGDTASATGAASDTDAHSDHDHDHGPVNPHLWTSPRYAGDMAAHVGAEFARIDPAHAADYTARAAAYDEQLTALDTWVAAQFAAVPEQRRVMVSGHDSLRYYLHDYDIAFAGAILPSFEDNAEPSAADIDALVAVIRERGVPAVFVESSMSPKLARTIAREADVRVVDAESLYADSIGAADSGADTYVAATIHNTRVILEAWGAPAEPLPDTLQS